MLVENTREEALKAFLNGNEGIMAAVKMADGGMRFVHISDLLPDDAVYFINVELGPADDYEEKIRQHCRGGDGNGDPSSRSGAWENHEGKKSGCAERKTEAEGSEGYHRAVCKAGTF